jgi:hypothetical protein
MSAISSCPQCGAAAEITERFALPSTDGPVPHVALSCIAGHHFRMAAERLPRLALPARTLPRSVQLCIHCRQTAAGFWVSRKNSVVAHRPWCLACCERLDKSRCEIVPFAS